MSDKTPTNPSNVESKDSKVASKTSAPDASVDSTLSSKTASDKSKTDASQSTIKSGLASGESQIGAQQSSNIASVISGSKLGSKLESKSGSKLDSSIKSVSSKLTSKTENKGSKPDNAVGSKVDPNTTPSLKQQSGEPKDLKQIKTQSSFGTASPPTTNNSSVATTNTSISNAEKEKEDLEAGVKSSKGDCIKIGLLSLGVALALMIVIYFLTSHGAAKTDDVELPTTTEPTTLSTLVSLMMI